MRNDLNELRIAVEKSPDNIALRMSLALRLLKVREFEECEKNYQHVLKIDKENIKAKQGLLELYFAKENYSAVIVIAEELSQRNIFSEKMMELYIKALIRQNNIKDAQEVYNKLLDRNPFFFDEEIETVLSDEEDDDEVNDEFDEDFENFGRMNELHIPDFIDNPEMMMMPTVGSGFEDIVGCDELKSELETLYSLDELTDEIKTKHNIKNCQSLLIYGPPGCGKSYTVSCIPIEYSENIMAVDLNKTSNADHSVKNEYLLTFYFNMVQMAGPMTLYFDHFEEIMGYGEQSKLLFNNQFETEMDKVYRHNLDLILLATSTKPWKINPSWHRYGRFDNSFFLAPPSEEERLEFFIKKLPHLPKAKLEQLASQTPFYSFADLTYGCERANYQYIIENNLKDVIAPIDFKNILEVFDRTKSSTLYWFEQFKLEADPVFKKTLLYDTIMDYITENKL